MLHSTTVPLDILDQDFITASTPILQLDGMGDLGFPMAELVITSNNSNFMMGYDSL
jgi:hypothetical protein